MVSMLGPSPGKYQAQKTQRNRALVSGDGPKIDRHLHVPVVLSSSHGALENKKSSKNSKVCLRHAPRTGTSQASLARALFHVDASASAGAKIPLT
jgi:hypothetical protein